MQLAIGSTAFAITQGGLTEAEPYRLLENNQLLIGTDTVELYLTSKGALSLEPTSRAVREAESIRLIYALRFTQLPH
ncbi:hypothetical protein HBN54_004528 [Hymenobacter sp. 1B]|uniref:Quercetin 2,3-dioxygenase C-terminal cupin domain-containing protein n=1 Tax=Hymenobacter artigasi TaxID=2719616 RepID=A0ABX1HP13_9BACT|nr:hypothetical protein [Hymenobacter artigasi]